MSTPTPGASGQPRSATIRPAAPSDLRHVLHIRQAQEQADLGAPFITAERLAADWEALGRRLGKWVWVAESADGNLLACAELARVGEVFNLCLWTQPDRHDSIVELALLDKAEQWACTLGREAGAESVSLFAQSTAAFPRIQQALLQTGYVVTSSYEQMEASPSEARPEPEAITGVVVLPFITGQDAEAVYRADEEAFQDQRSHTPRSFEQWRQRLNQSGEVFDPSLWLIAWDGDAVAGAALGEVVHSVGWIHHLFVRRPWRRRGLGAALTRAALGAFARHSISVVRLNVDGDSLTNAHQLYRREGFRVIGAYTNYQKLIALP